MAPKRLMPLSYAIIAEFMDGKERNAADVFRALLPDYGSYKLLTLKDIDEALATAKENGLLDETSCQLDENGELAIGYAINEFGRDMVEKYLPIQRLNTRGAPNVPPKFR